MKKYRSIFITVMVVILCLSGCSNHTKEQSEKLQIVTTIFPAYDWVREVLGADADYADITMLLDNGVDLHSYQPTADDLIKISNCNMFVYVGGESEEWVEDALKNAANKDRVVINLMEVLGDSVKEEELVEGMQESEEHESHDGQAEEKESHDDEADAHESHDDEADAHESHDDEADKHESHDGEADEHVWLSLNNAQVLCRAIADALAQVDPDHKEKYAANLAAYTKNLSDLDTKYKTVVDSAPKKTLLFADRFPFRYLVDDYKLDYYAAFSGCSAETEASFETIIFLSNKVDELGLNAILTIEGTQHKIAETVISNTQSQNQQVLTMDSMQSTTLRDVKKGATYLSIMEDNLKVLKVALN